MSFPLLVIAALGAVAIVVSRLAKRAVPEIVVFLALGVLIGPQGPFDIINERNIRSLVLVTQVALAAVIFLIGDRLRFDDLKGRRRLLVPLNVTQVIASVTLVFAAMRLVGADTRTALVLALIAAETGVLTVTATVSQERARGEYTDVLLTSVGLTNVAAAALFGLAFPFVAAGGPHVSLMDSAQVFMRLVVLSALVGLAGGWLLRTFARNFDTSGELLMFLLIVLIGITGAARAGRGSVVVSALIAGLYVANSVPWLADRLFAAVRTLEAPIYLAFFTVAGAGIHLDELASVGALGAAYLVARTVGKIGGSVVGTLVSGQGKGPGFGLRAGAGLLPHAGMAIGLVALVVEQAPALGETVSAVVLGSIVGFELGGPILTRRALRAAGEAGMQRRNARLEEMPDLAPTRSFERMLVPVGAVEVVLPRLPFLLDLAANLGAELVAVHVSRPGSGLAESDEPQVLELVRRVAEERDVTCHTVHRLSERVAATLVSVAEEHQVSLIVMGEPARTGVLEPSRWGRVAQRVTREVTMPVLVYPVDPSDPGRVPAVYVRRALRAGRADAAAGNEPAREPPEHDLPEDDLANTTWRTRPGEDDVMQQ